MRSYFTRIGGKRNLAGRIIQIIPEHRVYVEPFCGACWVFFKKPRSEMEVLNDKDPFVYHILTDIRTLTKEDVCEMDFLAGNKNTFIEYKKDLGVSHKDRFYRSLWLLNNSFGANGESYTDKKKYMEQHPLYKKRPHQKQQFKYHFDWYKQRLDGVRVHNEDFLEIIDQYDAEDAFFYLDPPYEGSNKSSHSYDAIDLSLLKDRLVSLNGKFLLSINDSATVRELFSDFTIEEVRTHYSLNSKIDFSLKGGKTELLIRNY